MSKLVFISGGVRSGKSSFAVSLAKREGKEVTFVATAKPIDREMVEKIKKHKRSRPKNWLTLEVERSLIEEIKGARGDTLLLDCLTLYVSQILSSKGEISREDILKEIRSFIEFAKNSFSLTIVVTNEVGSGVIPEKPVGRKFSEILGEVNQLVAKSSDEAYLLVSGIPLKVK